MKYVKLLANRRVCLELCSGPGRMYYNLLKSWFDYVVLNEYESTLLAEIMGEDIAEIAKTLKAAVVTKGANGSDIFVDGNLIHIEPISVKNEADPTGCGDAYRAGLIYGIVNDLTWEQTGKLGSILGSIKVSHNGTQNHSFILEELLQQL